MKDKFHGFLESFSQIEKEQEIFILLGIVFNFMLLIVLTIALRPSLAITM